VFFYEFQHPGALSVAFVASRRVFGMDNIVDDGQHFQRLRRAEPVVAFLGFEAVGTLPAVDPVVEVIGVAIRQRQMLKVCLSPSGVATASAPRLAIRPWHAKHGSVPAPTPLRSITRSSHAGAGATFCGAGLRSQRRSCPTSVQRSSLSCSARLRIAAMAVRGAASSITAGCGAPVAARQWSQSSANSDCAIRPGGGDSAPRCQVQRPVGRSSGLCAVCGCQCVHLPHATSRQPAAASASASTAFSVAASGVRMRARAPPPRRRSQHSLPTQRRTSAALCTTGCGPNALLARHQPERATPAAPVDRPLCACRGRLPDIVARLNRCTGGSLI
jgi:hypothetical protein